MRRLIRGDIRRILSKLGFYILPALYYVLTYSDPSSFTRKYEFDTYFAAIEFVYR